MEPAFYRRLVEDSLVGVYVSQAGRFVYVNRRMAEIFGYSREELLALPSILDLIDEDDRASVNEKVARQLSDENDLVEYVVRGRRKDGTAIALEIRGGRTEVDGRPALMGTLLDITERVRVEDAQRRLAAELNAANQRLQDLVAIDPLTETANRRGLEAALVRELARSRRDGQPLVAMLLDCDDFKLVNDELGHAVGDVVLCEVARRILATIRSSDQVARIGGDEFIVLLPATDLPEAARVADRIRLAVGAHPIIRSPRPVVVTLSIGVALVQSSALSVEEVLSLTRVALQQGKKTGKNQVRVANGAPDSDRSFVGRDLSARLSEERTYRALRQPILRLHDEQTVGYELLTRANVSVFTKPNDFFRVAQEHNILTLVDLLCLKTCLGAASALDPGVRYHVNLFPSTILNSSTERLLALFRDRQAPGARFCIELSEQQFFGDTRSLHRYLAAYREAGLTLALDDVGFGRTSLELLLMLEPDIVKIDRRLVQGAGSDPVQRRALERLVQMVTLLGASAVAEGIETGADLETARQAGIEYGQGFWWGWPLELDSPPALEPPDSEIVTGLLPLP